MGSRGRLAIATQVRCPGCGAPYEVNDQTLADLARRDILCPACGAVLSAPAPAAPPEDAVPLRYAAPSPPAGMVSHGMAGPPYAPPLPYFQPSWPDPRALMHRRLIGIFNIVAGGLNAVLAALLIGLVLLFGFTSVVSPVPHTPPRGAVPVPSPHDELLIMGAVAGVASLFSLLAALIQVLAGIWVLRRKRTARKWAIAAGIASCACFWTACFYCAL